MDQVIAFKKPIGSEPRYEIWIDRGVLTVTAVGIDGDELWTSELEKADLTGKWEIYEA